MEAFSDRLRQAMDAKKMNLAALSRRSGLNKGTISHYLAGSYKPKRDSIAKLSRALGVQPAWLMGFDVQMDHGAPFEEDLLLDFFRKLDALDKGRVIGYIESLLQDEKYTKKEAGAVG